MNDYDKVFRDTEGPGAEDGDVWALAPKDSAICWRFPTQADAQAFADAWIAERER